MRKEDKGNIIAQLGEVLNEYAHFYLVDVTGLNAATTSAMRRKCFQSEIKNGSCEEHTTSQSFGSS